MNKTFKEYLSELSSADVGNALAQTDDQLKAKMQEPEAKRRQDIAQQQDLQRRSADPLDRAIAQARDRLAQLLKQKAMKDRAQQAGGAGLGEAAIVPFSSDHIKGMAETIYDTAEKQAYDESAQYEGGTKVSGDEIEYHAEQIIKSLSHLFMDDVKEFIETKHMKNK